MITSLTTAQTMSLHSGFAYCSGLEIGMAVKAMLGHDSMIAACLLRPLMAEALEQQLPWLVDVPNQPNDWRTTLAEFEHRHGARFEVKNNAEQLNGII